ncbi:hypothetical protein PspLS_10806 [Pyricularia sp. CBS 133598]|nr:hypothetical protein PspLS_10806 [Pyricularia sp. CBS 133598]
MAAVKVGHGEVAINPKPESQSVADPQPLVDPGHGGLHAPRAHLLDPGVADLLRGELVRGQAGRQPRGLHRPRQPRDPLDRLGVLQRRPAVDVLVLGQGRDVGRHGLDLGDDGPALVSIMDGERGHHPLVVDLGVVLGREAAVDRLEVRLGPRSAVAPQRDALVWYF